MNQPKNTDVIHIIEEKNIYKNHLNIQKVRFTYTRHNHEQSQPLDWDIAHKQFAATVLPYDPKTDEIVLIEQVRLAAYLAGLPPHTLEAPAGVIDVGVDPLDTAIKELQEETGLTASKLIPITKTLTCPGALTELVHIYCGLIDAGDIHEGIFGVEAENEEIRVIKFKREDAFKMIETGEITAAPAIIALQWLMLNYQNL